MPFTLLLELIVIMKVAAEVAEPLILFKYFLRFLFYGL